MLEWYVAGFDYHQLMAQCENHDLFCAQDLGIAEISRKNNIVNLDPPWERITVVDAFFKYAPVSLEEALAQNIFDEILVDYIEPRLGIERPTFIYDYPAKLAALAKLKDIILLSANDLNSILADWK